MAPYSLPRQRRGGADSSAEPQEIDLDVLVVGAGPVGATAALELLRHGVPPQRLRIIDSASGPASRAKASSLWPRTLELFRYAHPAVFEQFSARATKVEKLRVLERCASGVSELICLHLAGNVSASEIQYMYALEQYATEEILRKALALQGVRVEWNTRLHNLQETNGAVTVSLSEEEAAAKVVRARFVVGCDGAHSQVRHLLDLEFKGETMEELRFFVAHADVTGLPPEVARRDTLSVTLARRGICMAIPFKDGRAEFVFDLPADKIERVFGSGKTDRPTVKHLSQLFEEVFGEGVRVEGDPQWMSAFRIHSRQVDEYCKGRVFMCGDACHIHSPFGGQGMNYGIQDAFNLGWKLGAVLVDAASPVLLKSYTQERYEAGRMLVEVTEKQTKGFVKAIGWRAGSERFTQAMNTVMRAAQDWSVVSAASKGFLVPVMSQLWVGYRRSSITQEHWGVEKWQWSLERVKQRHLMLRSKFTSRVKAGDRVPDVQLEVCGKKQWLHAVCCRNAPFTVLLFEAAEGFEDSKRWHGGLEKDLELLQWELCVLGEGLLECVVVDKTQKEAQKAFGVGGQCLFLVRPDGYIAFRSQPASRSVLVTFLRDRLGLTWVAGCGLEDEPDQEELRLKSIEAAVNRNSALLGLGIVLLLANLGVTYYFSHRLQK